MPRTLPAALSSAMDAGSFKTYLAIGQRNYSGTTLVDYTTLITDITYYKYDGIELTIKWASPNLPAVDGLYLGSKYYLERGIISNGVPSTIKTADLRFDNYEILKQIVTAKFSLFSENAKPATIAGDDTYTVVLTALNPLGAYGTTSFKTTIENPAHWGYNFLPTGKQVIVKSYRAFLPLIRQKYLIEVTDNSDDTNENEVEYFHLSSQFIRFTDRVASQATWNETNSWAYSPTLGLYVIAAYDVSNPYQPFLTSTDGTNWTRRSFSLSTQFNAICWSAELSLFVAVGTDTGTTPRIATSPDGITWTPQTSILNENLTCVTWVADFGLFLCGARKFVGETAQITQSIQTSPDGITWTARTTSFAGGRRGFAYSSELGICYSYGVAKSPAASYDIYSTTDGITWTGDFSALGRYDAIYWSSQIQKFIGVRLNLVNHFTTNPGTTDSYATGMDSITETPTNITYHNVLNVHILFGSTTLSTQYVYTSPDAKTWIPRAITKHPYKSAIWIESENKLILLWHLSGAGGVIESNDGIDWDIEIERGDIKLLTDNKPLAMLWRDEAGTIHTSGENTSTIHNLGYLESTDQPPNNLENSGRASITTGIQLSYKSGDVFKLSISEDVYAIYHAQITEILDTNAEIGWRCEIELIERFSNTNGGAMPSTIERIAAYTPLVTTNFDGNLDATVNNLQAFADRVDDLDLITDAPSDSIYYGRFNTAWVNLKTYFDTVYGALANMVTNGNSHDHNGGDGGTIAHTSLSSIGTNTHAQIDTFIAAQPTLATGTYTPTLTNGTNVAASASSLWNYMRIGNQVVLNGFIEIDTTAVGAFDIGISIPIASNFSATTDASGNGTHPGTGVPNIGSLREDQTNDRLRLDGYSQVNTNLFWRISGGYIIK